MIIKEWKMLQHVTSFEMQSVNEPQNPVMDNAFCLHFIMFVVMCALYFLLRCGLRLGNKAVPRLPTAHRNITVCHQLMHLVVSPLKLDSCKAAQQIEWRFAIRLIYYCQLFAQMYCLPCTLCRPTVIGNFSILRQQSCTIYVGVHVVRL